MGDAAAIRRQRFENKVGQLKQREGMVQDFERMLSTETRVREEARALERVEQIRRNRNRAEIESELQQEAQLDALALKAKQREFSDQEAKICTELERRKREQIMEERVLHKIRTESTELRDLEMKLRQGYMNMERKLQIDQKADARLKEMALQQALDNESEARRIRANEAERQKAVRLREANIRTRHVVEDQIAESQLAKQAAYEEFLHEKAMVDEICRRLAEEDEAERLAKMQKQRETKEYIDGYLVQRQILKQQERQRTLDENEQIMRYAKQKAQHERQRREEKAAKSAGKDAILQRLTDEANEKQRRETEMLSLRNELHWQEETEKQIERGKREFRAKVQAKVEMIQANEFQKELKAQKVEQQRMEDEAFREKMLAKFANDDRIELLNAQRRRMKAVEHKREVERLIAVRKELFERQRLSEIEEREEEERREQYRAAIIEQERQRLLREHATKLLGHLPKGVLQYETDRRLVGLQ